MLIKATKEIVTTQKEVWYQIALDPARSSYPLFCDGIKTEADFSEHLERGLLCPNHTMLLYLENDTVLGAILFFTEPEENYLQLIGLYIQKHIQAALDELMQYLNIQYKGYDLYFGFSAENREAAKALNAHGFSLIENDNHDVMIFSQYHPQPCSECIRRIGRDSFDDFRTLHKVDPTVYWNSDRIYDCFDQWNIYVYYEDQTPVAAIFETDGEIYGVDFRDNAYREELFCALVTCVLNDLKARGYESMTFFNDEETQQAALRLGFRFADRYHLYRKVIE